MKLKTIEIPEDSELKSIENQAFKWSIINNIFIPENVDELKEGWCAKTENLTNVIISPKNKHFK